MAEPTRREWWFSATQSDSGQKQTGASDEKARTMSLPSVSLPKGGGAIKASPICRPAANTFPNLVDGGQLAY